jgi:hypothetical protein
VVYFLALASAPAEWDFAQSVLDGAGSSSREETGSTPGGSLTPEAAAAAAALAEQERVRRERDGEEQASLMRLLERKASTGEGV